MEPSTDYLYFFILILNAQQAFSAVHDKKRLDLAPIDLY